MGGVVRNNLVETRYPQAGEYVRKRRRLFLAIPRVHGPVGSEVEVAMFREPQNRQGVTP